MDQRIATAMQQQGSVDYAGVKPEKAPPQPVDSELANDLSVRLDHAAAEAAWHEEQAGRFRAVQRACQAGLDQINQPQQQDQSSVY